MNSGQAVLIDHRKKIYERKIIEKNYILRSYHVKVDNGEHKRNRWLIKEDKRLEMTLNIATIQEVIIIQEATTMIVGKF